MGASNNRVLHVIDHLTAASGVASVVMQCITGIHQIKQDIALYGQYDSYMGNVVKECGGKVHTLPEVTKSLGKNFSKSFSQLMRDNSYNIIHGHLMNSAFIYLREAKQAGVPCRIIHAHSATSADTVIKRVRNNILSFGIPLWANKFIAVSNEAALYAFGRNIEKKTNIAIIHNGIDSERFKYDPVVREKTRKELGLTEDTLCVGNIARFTELKNHNFLIDVFGEMKKKANCVLLMIGEGPTKKAIIKKINDSGFSNAVRILVSRQNIEQLYQAFDILILPSLKEGFGLVALEAQCAGLNCVVSEFVPQTISCSGNIRFLPLGNAALWSDTALKMTSNQRSDGSAGVNEAKLDSATMCGKILKVYDSVKGNSAC